MTLALSSLITLGLRRPVTQAESSAISRLVQSKVKGATKEFLENRLIDQPSNIVQGLVEKAGLAKNVNGFEYLEALAANQSRLASQAYPLAYSKDIDARPFRQYVDRDLFKNAYANAVKNADAQGKKLPSLESIRNAQSVPTEILHEIKIGLDQVVDSNTDALTGKMTKYGATVVKVKDEFNDLIKSLNNDYRKANEEFADAERIKKAFSMGEKYQTLNPAEAASKIKKMTSDEKEAFRLGVMADVNERLIDYKSGDFTKQVFKSEKQKLLLRNAFTDTVDANGKVKSAQDSYTEFSQYVKGLNRQAETKQRVLAGSRTDENQAVREQANLLGSLTQAVVTSDPVSMLRAGGSALLSRANNSLK